MDPSPTITTFNVPGARNTEPFAINDSGVVTGVYSTSMEFWARGFVRAADGTITTFDAPGWTSSNKYEIVPLSINVHGVIAGYIVYGSGHESGFIRLPDGTIKKVWAEPDHKNETVLWAIGNSGAAVGTYNASAIQCFIRRASGVLKFIDCGARFGPSAINASNTVTGMFGGANEAFVRAAGGTYAKFHADQIATAPVGINSSGTIAGYFRSEGGHIWDLFARPTA